MRETDADTGDEVFSEEATAVVRRQIVQMTGRYGSPTHAGALGLRAADSVIPAPAPTAKNSEHGDKTDVTVTSPAGDSTAERKTKKKRRSGSRKSEEIEAVTAEQVVEGSAVCVASLIDCSIFNVTRYKRTCKQCK